MVMLHTFLALAAGFATLVIAEGTITALLRRLWPLWADEELRWGSSRAFTTIAYSTFVAVGGGAVTAAVAQANPLIHTLALALIVLLLAGLSAMQNRNQQPNWFLLTLVVLMPFGVFAGGFIRLKMAGIL